MHHLLRIALLGFCLAGAGCAAIPYTRDGITPPALAPEDGSPARAALNARVYDAAARYTARLFYRADATGDTFADAVHAGRDDAIRAPDEPALYAALDALLTTLDDDHTYAQSPTTRARLAARDAGRESASYGMLLIRIGDAWMVATVRPGTDAASAGIQPGWTLLDVDGQPVATAADPVPGHAATLRFRDGNNAVHAVSLTAAMLPPLPMVERRTLDDGTLYLRFDQFDTPRFNWLAQQFETIADMPPPAIVLDLRRNGGGNIATAALVNAVFFPDTSEFAILEGRFIDRRLVGSQPVHFSGPLSVLVGPATASAAELLAARLQETGRATLVGQTTRGAVVGTRAIDLPDGGVLHVGQIVMTTADGRSLEKTGVVPDVPVALDWQAVRDGHDPTLDAALAHRSEDVAATGAED